MKANLAVVWFSPEYKGGGGSRQSDGARRPGNGHPRPSSILIVEDDVLVRMSVADHLRECGYRVIEAGSGYEAQRIMKGGAPVELLFSDIDLGVGMNGIGLATWVRQEYPAVRILLASGATQLAQEATHLCDGPFLPKPYSYKALVSHIKRALALHWQTG